MMTSEERTELLYEAQRFEEAADEHRQAAEELYAEALDYYRRAEDEIQRKRVDLTANYLETAAEKFRAYLDETANAEYDERGASECREMAEAESA